MKDMCVSGNGSENFRQFSYTYNFSGKNSTDTYV